LHSLSGEHDGSARRLDDERLVPRRVTRRRDQRETRRDLRRAVEELVRQAGHVDPLGDGVLGNVHHPPFVPLREDRNAGRETNVLPAVVEVQVAVGDAGDVGESDPL
jgi:hypothetical protein